MTIEVIKKSNNGYKENGEVKSIFTYVNKNRHCSGDTVQNQKNKSTDDGSQRRKNGEGSFPSSSPFVGGGVWQS